MDVFHHSNLPFIAYINIFDPWREMALSSMTARFACYDESSGNPSRKADVRAQASVYEVIP